MTRAAQAFAPGRTELAGNHTDHQGGRVIAATLDCGVSVEAVANGMGSARVVSEGFAPADIALDDLSPREDERFTTAALVRGVIAGLRGAGVAVEGFDAQVESDVPAGGGLSSSAAFEVALARALCELFGFEGTRENAPESFVGAPSRGARDVEERGRCLTPVTLARVCQRAERNWFGKACGLMDQLAVALGGIVAIDFAEVPEGGEPRIERIDFDFTSSGHALCLIDTHCDHSLFTQDYSQVSLDMSAAAELFGAKVLSQVSEDKFFERFGEVRDKLGDVPALRALHFFHENRLVDARARALRQGDFRAFLHFTRISGSSSAQFLQNVAVPDRASQPAMVALALADKLLEGEGAARIHGGGFGGSIQVFVPFGRVGAFTSQMDSQLGAGSCRIYEVSR